MPYMPPVDTSDVHGPHLPTWEEAGRYGLLREIPGRRMIDLEAGFASTALALCLDGKPILSAEEK